MLGSCIGSAGALSRSVRQDDDSSDAVESSDAELAGCTARARSLIAFSMNDGWGTAAMWISP